MIYYGIDLHKKYSYVTSMDKEGNILSQQKVLNHKDSLTNFLSTIPSSSRIALEATCNWQFFYELSEVFGLEVSLAHPLKTRAIAEAKVKTDKVDSTILAHLLRTNLLPKSYIPDQKTRDLKELLRYRASLVKLRVQVKNKIHSILLKNGISFPYSDTFGKGGINFLKQLPLRDCFCIPLEGYLRLLELFSKEIKRITTILEKLVKKNPQALLLTVLPGIGYYSALLVVAEIGNIHRFPDYRHLCSYAGLVPSVHSSAGHAKLGHISKQGSRWLRWILVEAALQAGRSNTSLGSYYQRIAKRKGTKIARISLARQMLRKIYFMLKYGEDQ